MKSNRMIIWLAIVFVLLAVGALAGGVIVYATNSGSQSALRAGENDRASAERVALDDSEAGIVVAAVAPDGPAAQAGLVRGDILLAIDDEPVDSPLQLRRLLEEHEVGDQVALTVLHGDDRRTLDVTLGERDSRPYLGLTPCNVFPEVEPLRIVPEVAGSMVVRVLPATPADQVGLQEGDRIVAVDGKRLDLEDDLADLITAREPGDEVTLEIERPGEDSFEVTVRLDEHPEKEGVAYLGVEYLPLPHLERFEGGVYPFESFPFHGFPFEDEGFSEDPFVMPPEGEMVSGALIMRVVTDSPADEAGLREGDVITMIDEAAVESQQDLVDAIAAMAPGDTVTLTIYGSGEEQERTVEVTLAAHPEGEDQAYLGVAVGSFRRGFFRSRPSEGRESPGWMRPLREFLERLPFNRHFDFDNQFSFEFDTEPQGFLRRFPFHLDFELPELFEELPCCSGDSAA